MSALPRRVGGAATGGGHGAATGGEHGASDGEPVGAAGVASRARARAPRGRVLMLLDNAFAPDPRVAREARSLTRAGWQVRVVCWDREAEHPERETVDGVEIIRVRTPSARGLGLGQLKTLGAFYRAVWRRRDELVPDGVSVVHAHDLLMLPLGAWLKGRYGARLVYDAHEIYVRMEAHKYPAALLWAVDRAETLLANGAVDLFLTVSDQRVDHWWERRIDGPPIRVCGNWYDPRPVDAEVRRAVRAEHGIPEGAFVVGYAGGLNRNRRVDLLVDAVAGRHGSSTASAVPGASAASAVPGVSAASGLPGVHALVAGRGPREAAVREAAARSERVHFLGWIDDPWRVYHACDALFYAVDPSHPYAALNAPNNAYAALALGLPLIAGGGGEAEALVRETGYGAVLRNATVDAVREAIEDLRGQAAGASAEASAAGASAAAPANAHPGATRHPQPADRDHEALRASRSWAAAERALLEAYEELLP